MDVEDERERAGECEGEVLCSKIPRHVYHVLCLLRQKSKGLLLLFLSFFTHTFVLYLHAVYTEHDLILRPYNDL